MDLKNNILSLLEPKLKDTGIFVVSLYIQPGRVTHICFSLEKDSGINIDECAGISRYLLNELSANPEYDFPYTLEVSSPGIDKPFVHPRQYNRNINKHLRVITNDGSSREGILENVYENGIVLKEKLETKGKKKDQITFSKNIAFSEIKEAKCKL